MGKNKTYSTVFVTTSGDFVDQGAYSAADTYEPVRREGSNISVNCFSTKYGRAVEKTKIYTPLTRKHDELLSINEKLKKLG